MTSFKNINVIQHPLARHKLTMIRSQTCFLAHYRQMMEELGSLICIEASRNLRTVPSKIQTPIAPYNGVFLDQKQIMILPILRAGLNMANGFQAMMPMASFGHIGLLRKGSEIAHYFTSIPPIKASAYFLVDPIVATGDTMDKALNILLTNDVPSERIHVCTLIMSRQGANRLGNDPAFAKVSFWTLEIDEDELTESGYVSPGLGDAGDRLFGTNKAIGET